MKRIMAVAATVSMLALFALASHATAQGEPTASVDPEYVSAAGSHTVTVSGSGWPANPAITACTGFGGVLPGALDQGTTIANCPSLMMDLGSQVSAPGGSFSTSVTVDVPAEGLVLLVFTTPPNEAGVPVLIKVGEAPAEEPAEEPAEDTAEDADAAADDDAAQDDAADDDATADDDAAQDDSADDAADAAEDDSADDDAAEDDMADDAAEDDMADSGDMAEDDAADDDAAAEEDMAEEDMADDMVPEGGAATGFGGTAGSDGNSVAVPLAATLAAVILLGGAALVARRNA